MDRCQNRCPARQHWPLPPTPWKRSRQERWDDHQDHLQLSGMTGWPKIGDPKKNPLYTFLVNQLFLAELSLSLNLNGIWRVWTFLDSDPLTTEDSMWTLDDLVFNPLSRVYNGACCSTGWIILFAASRFHQNLHLAQLHRTKLPCILGKCPRTSTWDGKCMLSAPRQLAQLLLHSAEHVYIYTDNDHNGSRIVSHAHPRFLLVDERYTVHDLMPQEIRELPVSRHFLREHIAASTAEHIHGGFTASLKFDRGSHITPFCRGSRFFLSRANIF